MTSPMTVAPVAHRTRAVRLTTVLFWAVHVAAVVGVVVTGWSWGGLALAFAAYFVRMFVVTAAYHRYFSHRAFKTSRVFQFVLALGAQSAAQKGVLWWASRHRLHHKHSDTVTDVHSPRQRGFWYSHLGWILTREWTGTDLTVVSDLAKFPELRALNNSLVGMLPAVGLALAFFLIGGLHAFIWGFLVSTVLLWHGSFAVNSLAHVFGRQRYETGDDSRNNWLIALMTSGEGWHNNHHHYQSSANQGFEWWQVDVTYYLLRAMAACGLVWDLRRPPSSVVQASSGSASAASVATALTSPIDVVDAREPA
jgi:stearoyl-CoA desaturase (Delta-9 desaturase)